LGAFDARGKIDITPDPDEFAEPGPNEVRRACSEELARPAAEDFDRAGFGSIPGLHEGTGGAMALSILAKNDDPTSPLRKGYPRDALFAGNKVELRGANKVGGARTRRELFCSGRLQAGPLPRKGYLLRRNVYQQDELSPQHRVALFAGSKD